MYLFNMDIWEDPVDLMNEMPDTEYFGVEKFEYKDFLTDHDNLHTPEFWAYSISKNGLEYEHLLNMRWSDFYRYRSYVVLENKVDYTNQRLKEHLRHERR